MKAVSITRIPVVLAAVFLSVFYSACSSDSPERGTMAQERGNTQPEHGTLAPEHGTLAPERGTMAPQFASPMQENARRHERLQRRDSDVGLTVQTESVPGTVRVFQAASANDVQTAPLLVHFHGSDFIPFAAAESLGMPVLVASVNLGSGSSAYETPFLCAEAFDSLVAEVLSTLEVTPDGNRRILLSAFSAGYGAVRAILRAHSDKIDGVLLLDGLHVSYQPEGLVLFDGGALDTTNLDPFLSYARSAVGGEKYFLLTHSEIFPGAYASTTETADYLLAEFELERQPVLEWGPVGMQLLSRAEAGHFVVLGFAGNSAPDHVDHLHGMPAFLKMLLNE